jgi:hypothetical protein
MLPGVPIGAIDLGLPLARGGYWEVRPGQWIIWEEGIEPGRNQSGKPSSSLSQIPPELHDVVPIFDLPRPHRALHRVPGEILKLLRTSVYSLALRIGCSRPSSSPFEHVTGPSPETFARMHHHRLVSRGLLVRFHVGELPAGV